MSDLTMIGLGAMGSALARTFLVAGHRLTVWNRSPDRMAPFEPLGATLAPSAAKAAAASPVSVLCIDNYDATHTLLASPGVADALSGRILVQLSTGTPAEARALQAWLDPRGIGHIDGAIMPYPDGIGADDAQILFAGPATLYAACLPRLACLGGDLRHVGSEIGAAAALDMALLTHQLTNYLGVWHGARVCEAEGIGVDSLAALFPQDDPAAHLAWRIHREEFDTPGATLDVWNAALDRILQQAEDAGITSEIPGLVSSLFRRAIALGHGARDIGTVMDVLRGSAPA
ncbi:NAD(P)-dependent oxidoreductase [Ovoidimarina sediminis]|uniref:NAD(P)-dependent oxidoreductase n=1 Tax=Ovoidimarina sediminis TaxID=3079856 RepID=UPI0029076666|nr:NAD(P)-binding domain-containing protein [Rhodophyticola sp. MJ-SS7]MDU8942348.1 NAD(P)-binding domain-containing protein [Rhodophyticola sp. MJ-SS7]